MRSGDAFAPLLSGQRYPVLCHFAMSRVDLVP